MIRFAKIFDIVLTGLAAGLTITIGLATLVLFWHVIAPHDWRWLKDWQLIDLSAILVGYFLAKRIDGFNIDKT